ncbi:uncharacterized protein MONBRDRAFT_25751 [Monosiga brevicollis MX1]|uniref:Protein kinase domain-containing protein n=1 Tax=Monosiga brevicollis TaxID=81824 RepID=A9V0B6_MONBE|nr:uncharacterized protein MONBRDRAFT_25751 [Monosiga brevicollis MX1]EDQ89129.1 predicted protein [Monosiga brevicollis MX1]|eukprot:XP_001746234.1 hypothetical protein [Monosiga brevicollis MX1]
MGVGVCLIGLLLVRSAWANDGCAVHLLGPGWQSCVSCPSNFTSNRVVLVPPFSTCTVLDTSPSCARRLWFTHYECAEDGSFILNRNKGRLTDPYVNVGCRVHFYEQERPGLVCDGHDSNTTLLYELPLGGAPSNLKRLVVRNHALLYAETTHFSMLQLLEELDLSNNAISLLYAQALPQLVNLKYLNLSHNRLTSLEPLQLPFQNSLQTLDVQGNEALTLRSDLLISSMAPDCTTILLPETCLDSAPSSCTAFLPASTPPINSTSCTIVDNTTAWTCPDGSTSITNWQYCDGIPDCADGWDEENCCQLAATEDTDYQTCSEGHLQVTIHQNHAQIMPPNPASVNPFCFSVLSIRYITAAWQSMQKGLDGAPEWSFALTFSSSFNSTATLTRNLAQVAVEDSRGYLELNLPLTAESTMPCLATSTTPNPKMPVGSTNNQSMPRSTQIGIAVGVACANNGGDDGRKQNMRKQSPCPLVANLHSASSNSDSSTLTPATVIQQSEKIAHTLVALKTFDEVELTDYKAVMFEAALMHIVGRHPHVIQLIGIIDDSSTNPTMGPTAKLGDFGLGRYLTGDHEYYKVSQLDELPFRPRFGIRKSVQIQLELAAKAAQIHFDQSCLDDWSRLGH